ncbi:MULTISPECIES: isochorismatase family protein [unclassified Neisseria]|uniref:Protein MARB-1 n=2 Tax=Neisseria musculi TaxID=1815583 RepID=A0A7H1ME99_9NEIS|nr:MULTISPECIES: isochorismatase family protein [unclassified Neisseria]MBF0804509.1 isochorismatase family protein [Neisseria sp. 19428wB4_WF04]QNT59964.1 protein MARB-1 [Neisseria musculi]TFU40487.1 isochorismatase family protein [Neisseria sp. WF04]
MPHPRPDNTACIVVDIQERLNPALHQAAEMVENSLTLLQGLQALGVPLAVTEQYPKGLGRTVAPVAGLLGSAPVFEKTRFSALIPETEQFLQSRRIQNVILIGAEAHVCMLQTVLDLRAAGLGVYVPFECTASRAPANKANALEQMRAAGAVVSNVESVLFGLLGDAKHPAFKTVSKLIQ